MISIILILFVFFPICFNEPLVNFPGVDIADDPKDAFHCYKVIADGTYRVGFDFNMVFLNAPSLLFMDADYTSSTTPAPTDSDTTVKLNKIVLQLVDEVCSTTLDIFDNNDKTKYINMNIKIYTKETSPPLTTYQFRIHPNTPNFVSTINDYYNIAEIYISKKTQAGTVHQYRPSTYVLANLYNIETYKTDCLCAAKENRKFIFRPMTNNNPRHFNKPYNEMEINLIETPTSGSAATPPHKIEMSIWPCECSESRLLPPPTIVIPDLPNNLRLEIAIQFIDGSSEKYITNYDLFGSTTDPSSTIYFKDLKIERIGFTNPLKNDKRMIYVKIGTVTPSTSCSSDLAIEKLMDGTKIFDVTVTKKVTYTGSHITRWVKHHERTLEACPPNPTPPAP